MAYSRKKRARKVPPKVPDPGGHGETCLHKNCQQWLKKSGIWDRLLIFHVPNERMGSIGAIMHFKQMGVRPGVADYLAFPITARKVAIEIKDKDGVQDEAQELFQAAWEGSGGLYVIVRTLEEFQGAVNALLLFC